MKQAKTHSRCRIAGFTIANWRNHRDRWLPVNELVVQLQGGNGVGKTTLMLAMAASFIPLKEPLDRAARKINKLLTGASGEGITSLIGLDGNPSFSVATIQMPHGHEIHAGLMLERRTGGGSEVSLSPFIVEDMPPEVTPIEWLAASDGRMHVSMREIEASVMRTGGRMHPFDTAKSYFQALHEARVLPRSFQIPSDQRLLVTILLDTLGTDPGDILSKLDAFLLSPGEDLMSYINALDQRLRGMIADRRRMRDYVGQATIIQEVWDAAERTLRTSWAWDMSTTNDAERRHNEAQALLSKRLAEQTAAKVSESEASAAADEADRTLEAAQAAKDSSLTALIERVTVLRVNIRSAERIAKMRRYLAALEHGRQPIANSAEADDIAVTQEQRWTDADQRYQVALAASAAAKQLLERIASGGIPDNLRALAIAAGGTPIAERADLSALDEDDALIVEARLGGRRLAIEADDAAKVAEQLFNSSGIAGDELWVAPVGSPVPGRLVQRQGERVLIAEDDGWMRVTRPAPARRVKPGTPPNRTRTGLQATYARGATGRA
jgi:hypothetical protein